MFLAQVAREPKSKEEILQEFENLINDFLCAQNSEKKRSEEASEEKKKINIDLFVCPPSCLPASSKQSLGVK